MREEYKHIEDLLERFFDGQTTNAEEKELYVFFESGEVPEHLVSYKPVFGYFESGLAGEIEDSEVKPVSVKPLNLRRKYLTIVTSVAAVVLLFFLLQPLFTTHKDTGTDPFEGSYIVRDGKRIDDLDRIRPELELTLQIALLQQEKADRLITMAEDDPFAVIEEEINAQYCEIINQFPDEHARKEVQQLLQIECK